MNLVVGATPHSHWHRLQPLLAHAGLHSPDETPLQHWQQQIAAGKNARTAHAELLAACRQPAVIDMSESPDQLREWLAVDEEIQLLLFYASPEREIAAAMREGHTPAAALEAWLSLTEALLSLYRQHRQRVILIAVAEAANSPNLFLNTLSTHTKLNVGPWGGPVEPLAPVEQDTATLMAAYHLIADANISALCDELEACSIPVTEPRAHVQLDHNLIWGRAQAQLQEHQDTLQALEASEQRLAASHQEHQGTLQELEASEQRLAASHQEHQGTLQALEACEQRLAEVSPPPHQAGAAAGDETELLLQQLYDAQAEIERCHREHRHTLGQELSAVQNELQRYQSDYHEAARQLRRMTQERDALRSSVSWRITAPLRWILRPIMGASGH
ncbi:hypothetical protein U5801_24360 [Lamprobacter modestohalophilus]|uniref:hypothetical protein n=1 Tax=Lamprobacter modestohalophilus TaxID=1064514 RepID=UPI002ADED500|nr:hypothetical protein [Lamprobacter modestohalophilus]MEA1052916.1 hypothetical protein [Lamprobacter modestohalophilus]